LYECATGTYPFAESSSHIGGCLHCPPSWFFADVNPSCSGSDYVTVVMECEVPPLPPGYSAELQEFLDGVRVRWLLVWVSVPR
jgi:hypothetical protein